MPVIVVPSLMRVHRRPDGAVHLDDKFIRGLNAFAERWPGRTVALAAAGPAPEGPIPAMRYMQPSDLAFDVVLDDLTPQALATLRPDLATLPLLDLAAPLMGVAKRTVLVAEHSGRSRYEMGTIAGGSPAHMVRQRLGWMRWQRRMRTLVRRADGLHCNGWTAWDAFGHAHPHALRYYDNRIPGAVLADVGHLQRGDPRVLRLGFSGRLLRIKGPRDAVMVAERLHASGMAVSLTIYGDGPEEGDLRSIAGPATQFAGTLDFATEWIDRISHDIDVMVLPHPQGDPSGTYVESLGAGVPVLGYANSHWSSLAKESGGGWGVPTGDIDALLATTRALGQDPDAVRQARAAGLTFMMKHHFEAGLDRRIGDLQGTLERAGEYG